MKWKKGPNLSPKRMLPFLWPGVWPVLDTPFGAFGVTKASDIAVRIPKFRHLYASLFGRAKYVFEKDLKMEKPAQNPIAVRTKIIGDK